MPDILQWNCRGLRAHSEFLKVLIRDFNPGVVCLQETKLGEHFYNPGLNFCFYQCCPPIGDRAKGGAAIIISKKLQHHAVQINTTLQAVAVCVILEKPITICSLYLPPDLNFNVNNLQNLIDQLPTPFLLLGDFNAHNPIWGSINLDAKGKLIETLIDNNPISFLNNGSNTYHNIHSNQSSAIDLSLCSANIHLDFLWSVDEFLNGSDHYPIHLKSVENIPVETSTKWKVEGADWGSFSQGINLCREFESFESHIDAYDYFIDSTLASAHDFIPKTKGKPHRPAVPWWNKTCSTLRKVTRKCYRRYKNSGSSQSKIIYQRAQAKQRKYFKTVKRESWLFYINGINSKVAASTVWKKIRKLSGKFVPSPLPSLKINGKVITDADQVAENLGEHFSQISSSRNYSPEFQKIRNAQITLDLGSKKRAPYNAQFTLKEMEEALSSTESTSPGEDSIIYEMLKHLPEAAKSFLLKIINKIWDTGILPESWKISIIIPVKKPNKEGFQPNSYRPIALTSVMCKLMEKMINTRLVWFLETNGLISPFQFGFRKNRSTLDPLFRLSNQIQQGFASQKQTIGVFFDLEKAYDTTWRHGIIKQFLDMGIGGKMIRFINAFLSDRYIKVKVGNKMSSLYKQEEGVPQGSVLSVTCFSVAINKIVEAVAPPVNCSLFVDDFVLYYTSYDALSACKQIQKAINAVSKWADSNGFKFSNNKTVAVRFTRRRQTEVVPTLTLKGTILPFEEEVKFLGVIFDKRLTWSSHIDYLKLKVKRSLNILKVVSGLYWGADKKTLLRLYDCVCRSKLDYACQIYSSACKSKLKELDVVHNQGLRICTGVYRTSPVESIYVDAGELPLDLRREELGLRFMARIKSSPENPSRKILGTCNSKVFNKPRSSKPFHVRLHEEVEVDNLKQQKIKKVSHSEVPPWFIPDIQCCKTDINKKTQSEKEIKAKFLDHDQVHTNHEKFYTDGSKSAEGVGCAVIHGEFSYVAKLPDSASVFTAELTAIIKGLEVINKTNGKSFVLYTDSKSSIYSLRKYNSMHPLIQKAQEWLFRLAVKHKDIHFCWVPAHVGIQGNEEADIEAKEAASLDKIQFDAIPHSDMKGPFRGYILRKWQERWSSPLLANNKKYFKIRNSIDPWPSSYLPNRRYEVVLTRLRVGHTRLTHKYLLEGSSAPVCAYCGRVLTVEHILVHCKQYMAERCNANLNNKDIIEILGDNVDVEGVMGFLKKIGIFFFI